MSPQVKELEDRLANVSVAPPAQEPSSRAIDLSGWSADEPSSALAAVNAIELVWLAGQDSTTNFTHGLRTQKFIYSTLRLQIQYKT